MVCLGVFLFTHIPNILEVLLHYRSSYHMMRVFIKGLTDRKLFE